MKMLTATSLQKNNYVQILMTGKKRKTKRNKTGIETHSICSRTLIVNC